MDKVQEALAALKANPPHDNNPLPWHFAETDEQGCDVISASEVHVGSEFYHKSAAHTCAAVNSAPVLAAEVERLQGLLAAARVAVGKLWTECRYDCACVNLPGRDCDCGAAITIELRRAVGLEESHG